MGVPSKPLPTIGESNSTGDPKLREALQELQGILNAAVDGSNLATGAVSTVKLEAALKASVASAACRLRFTVDQAIATPGARVSWTSEEFDTNSMHDNATNPSRITCQTAGFYVVTATVAWAADASGVRNVEILKNGLSVAAQEARAPHAADATRQTLATVLSLAVGDYLEVDVFHNSGATRTLVAANSHFAAARLLG